MTTTKTAAVRQTVQRFLEFVNASPSPFHAVHESVVKLVEAGFQPLAESEAWDHQVIPGGKYFVTRNQSAIIAFAVGHEYQVGRDGFSIIGAHTDSPCLKVKPISAMTSQGYLQVGVECYGGGLWHTWFDRDLGLAGRVIIENDNQSGFESKLVMINKPLLHIPTLAIHLDREVSTKGFSFNKEKQLRPVLATKIQAELNATPVATDAPASKNHHSVLINLLAQELGICPSRIRDFELCLFDTQGANTGGAFNEFIFSPRLDNLCCSYLSLEALLRSTTTLKTETNIRMMALFDNEEVGSNSRMGAGSNFLQQIMDRIIGSPEVFPIAAQKSCFISADMAHGVHPNYVDKHEENHRPLIHEGPVIKYNANERYATTGETAFLLKEIAHEHQVKLQEFVVRQDTGCGSTIGPILSTSTGIRTIDVGIAQLSMHSIREMCGTVDLEETLRWFEGFYNIFPVVDAKTQMKF